MVRQTEARHEAAEGLDQRAPLDILSVLAQSQIAAAEAASKASPAIAQAAEVGAAALKSGGRLIYVGAGSSGLMAMADALELPGTFGIALDRVVVLFAGGRESLHDLAGGFEDDVVLGEGDARLAWIGPKDCIICVSASGTTPYVLAVANYAKRAGARVVGLANNPGAPLLELADVPVLLQTAPEVISGSTRMGAGTAQKIAFNMFSTLMGIHLGHVYDGHMVNLRADNQKLRDRAARIVSDITGATPDVAAHWLQQSGGSVKLAVLLMAGADNLQAAQAVLDNAGQNLRQALKTLSPNWGTVHNRA